MSRIVELKDLRPLRILKTQFKGDLIEVCRCGLSANWPFCDGSHKAARGEEDGKYYRYTREVPSGNLVREEITELSPDQAPSKAQSPPDPPQEFV